MLSSTVPVAMLAVCQLFTHLKLSRLVGTTAVRQLAPCRPATAPQAPFRLPRIILFGGLLAGAALGLVIIVLRLIKSLQGERLPSQAVTIGSPCTTPGTRRRRAGGTRETRGCWAVDAERSAAQSVQDCRAVLSSALRKLQPLRHQWYQKAGRRRFPMHLLPSRTM